MQTPLKISTEYLTSAGFENRIFDLAGSCAFVVCLSGDFEIAIMNMVHHVERHTVLICLPFVSIRIMKVHQPGDVLVVGTELENIYVMSTVNRSIASNNLLLIRQHPVVPVDVEQIRYIKSSVDEYLLEVEECRHDGLDDTCRQIQQTIIDARSQLIIAQLLKLYFTNMPMEVRAHNQQDIVFQNFILDLYANFHENHNVKFYAQRSGLSVKYFSTIVRELSGATPSEWIETVITGEAKSRLYDAHRNVKEIAASLNFPDASTFTKYFARVTGQTPRAFRQSIIKIQE